MQTKWIVKVTKNLIIYSDGTFEFRDECEYPTIEEEK